MIGEALDQIREHYIRHFVDIFNQHVETEGVSIVHEAAFCDADGNAVVEGELSLPARGDLFIVRDGTVEESIQVDTESMLGFEPLEFQWPDSELIVDLSPFQWNWIQLRTPGLTPPVNWQPLRGWFDQWFKDDDPEEGELLGGIHFMSDPEEHDGQLQISIDLGTAPREAFEEMLDALARIGIKRLLIGQFDDQ